MVEVTNTRTVDKPVKLSYFRDEVDHAVQRAIRDGQLNIDIKRMERGIYVIGGARRNLTVQNSSLMVGGRHGRGAPCEIEGWVGRVFGAVTVESYQLAMLWMDPRRWCPQVRGGSCCCLRSHCRGRYNANPMHVYVGYCFLEADSKGTDNMRSICFW